MLFRSGTTVSSGTPMVTSGTVYTGDTLTTSQAFASKNVMGTNGSTLVASYTLADGNPVAGNNYSVTLQTAPGTITKAPLIVTGLLADDRVYNGTTSATLSTGAASLGGVFAGDNVNLGASVADFDTRHVGSNKPVTVSSLALGGTDGGNYEVTNLASLNLAASIIQRAQSNWISTAGGAWSDPNNWDALPDGSNVKAVSINQTGNFQITYDQNVGSTSLENLTSNQTLAFNSGSLNVSSALVTYGLLQSGGAISASTPTRWPSRPRPAIRNMAACATIGAIGSVAIPRSCSSTTRCRKTC